ncbi:putative pentatricopeptide repeat-containing protein At3g25970 [Rhodamnia argentea]|uniref:Pentatricopeptide repeat-containing protein At3g25970 n=1 Tax=Rhodamnia argentea TaxID=178133 RepID=A0A8B8P885_9MYRT|nr:putative pentatricopeptide repeat-containing protein At3g25970 [Rhodamnia argentea]XP_048133935.1 putative pentatricopeptide repeat-containing protein At3g25970 [Rhodamnia argentea]
MRALHSLVENKAPALSKALIAHCQAIVGGTLRDLYTANNILSGYTKCGEIWVAHQLFDQMRSRDTVSWNTMISGYVNSGKLERAWGFLESMRQCGLDLDAYTFSSMLKGVASASRLDLGRQLHSLIFKHAHAGNIYTGSALLDMYAKCERVKDAYIVLQHMPRRNSVSWNALISGFAQSDDRETAFCLLDSMENEGVKPEDGTFAPLLTLLDDHEFFKLTTQVHAKIMKHGLEWENNVCNAAINSYSECGSIEDAKKLFDSVVFRDIVTWNSMLAAYLVHGDEDSAFRLFIDMQLLGIEMDVYTYTSIISACFEEACENQGKSLHALVIKRGLEQSLPISNTLIVMYIKLGNGSMEEAISVFKSMDSKDRVSWNSMLNGYSQVGLSEDALELFAHMRSLDAEIDHYALSAVLKSCSDLATLLLGRQVHALALKFGFESNEFVGSGLVFMYSKCGIIKDARSSFEETFQSSSVTWNAIIFAYAQHGLGHAALDLFHIMRARRIKLDHITFVAVLTACSHIGLVEEGYGFLLSMETDYGIPPRMENYACAIDLFGRAGLVNEAKALVDLMPFQPDMMVWKTLLGACRSSGNMELACQVGNRLLELEPEEHSTYVLLSDMYGRLQKWSDHARVKRLMRERGVRKVPGWSWIEVQNQVHSFNAEDRSHPFCEDIYPVLEGLMDEVRKLGGDVNSEDSAQQMEIWFGSL